MCLGLRRRASILMCAPSTCSIASAWGRNGNSVYAHSPIHIHTYIYTYINDYSGLHPWQQRRRTLQGERHTSLTRTGIRIHHTYVFCSAITFKYTYTYIHTNNIYIHTYIHTYMASQPFKYTYNKTCGPIFWMCSESEGFSIAPQFRSMIVKNLIAATSYQVRVMYLHTYILDWYNVKLT